MTIKDALIVSDKVVCHACQCVTSHAVSLDEEELVIVFTCDVCGDECDETCVDIAK